jgi:hypothetical protein
VVRRFVVDPAAGVMEVRCVWCERPTRDWPQRMFQGRVVVCPCGAMGLLAPPHDFDEAAEELLAALGIDGEVAEPARPVGQSGFITARAYDGAASRRRLAEVLAREGRETRPEDAELALTSPLSGEEYVTTSWALWWRSERSRAV